MLNRFKVIKDITYIFVKGFSINMEELMSLIDSDVKDKIDEGTYLKLCDTMKNIHDTNRSKSICKIHFSVPYIRNYYNSISNANTREHNGIYISLVYSYTFMEVTWFLNGF